MYAVFIARSLTQKYDVPTTCCWTGLWLVWLVRFNEFVLFVRCQSLIAGLDSRQYSRFTRKELTRFSFSLWHYLRHFELIVISRIDCAIFFRNFVLRLIIFFPSRERTFLRYFNVTTCAQFFLILERFGDGRRIFHHVQR